MESTYKIPKPVLIRNDPIYIPDYYNYVLRQPNIYLKLFESFYILKIHLFNHALHPNYDICKQSISNKLFLFPVEAHSWSEELANKKYTCKQLFTHLLIHDNSIRNKQELLYQMILTFIKKQENNHLMHTTDQELKLFYNNHDIFTKSNYKSPPNHFREYKNKQNTSLFSFIFPDIFD